MWNGTVAFGEVIFPVKLYSIVQERRVRFREVHLADGGRIVHRRFGSESGEEVPSERIGKAYEISEGNQVVLDDEEIASARGREHEGDPDRAFRARPTRSIPSSTTAPTRSERKRAASTSTGCCTPRSRRPKRRHRALHAAHARAAGRARRARAALRLYTMRFADRSSRAATSTFLRSAASRPSVSWRWPSRLVETLAAPWEPEQFEDRHRQAVMALIEQKAAGEELRVPEIARA